VVAWRDQKCINIVFEKREGKRLYGIDGEIILKWILGK
jgi:hypothetical protein